MNNTPTLTTTSTHRAAGISRRRQLALGMTVMAVTTSCLSPFTNHTADRVEPSAVEQAADQSAASVIAAVDATMAQPWLGTFTLPDTPTETLRSANGAWELESADGSVQRFVGNTLWEGSRTAEGAIAWAHSTDSVDPFGRLFRSLGDAVVATDNVDVTGNDGSRIAATITVDPAACDGANAGDNTSCALDVTVEDERLTSIEFTDPSGQVRLTIGDSDPSIALPDPVVE